jgi:hypothetical protein
VAQASRGGSAMVPLVVSAPSAQVALVRLKLLRPWLQAALALRVRRAQGEPVAHATYR